MIGEELGISFGTAILVLIALYFVIKWAVKNGIEEAYEDITKKKIWKKILKNLLRNSQIPIYRVAAFLQSTQKSNCVDLSKPILFTRKISANEKIHYQFQRRRTACG